MLSGHVGVQIPLLFSLPKGPAFWSVDSIRLQAVRCTGRRVGGGLGLDQPTNHPTKALRFSKKNRLAHPLLLPNHPCISTCTKTFHLINPQTFNIFEIYRVYFTCTYLHSQKPPKFRKTTSFVG